MQEKIGLTTIAKMIDHSLLHPTMTDEDLKKGCLLARELQVASVCIKPYAVPSAMKLLEGSGVLTCTVVGFPHGGSSTANKVAETREACSEGAKEIDMVINIGKALGGDFRYVQDEIKAINDASLAGGAILKVIFENDFLGDATIIRLCEICNEAGVAFVKTSTGYGFVKRPNGFYSYDGATERQLKIMREHSAPGVQIKAAGGVRTLNDLLRVRSLGVSRVGATASAAIMEEARKTLAAGLSFESLELKPLASAGY